MKTSFTTVLQLLGVFAASAALASGAVHWGYDSDNGPTKWAKMDAKNQLCAAGQQQSPIDLRSGKRSNLKALSFSYNPFPLHVVNNGHTIQVNVPPGNTFTSGKNEYELAQFHFHTPSEHTVDGKQSPMEVHFVHKSKQGKYAVVGVMIEEGVSTTDAIDVIWNFAPKHAGEKKIAGLYFQALTLLPRKGGYYKYDGSLTTPPCSEGIAWHVMKTPISFSAEQIDTFKSIFPNNSRPVQVLGKRILEQL